MEVPDALPQSRRTCTCTEARIEARFDTACGGVTTGTEADVALVELAQSWLFYSHLCISFVP